MLTPFEVEQIAASIGRYAPAAGDQPGAALIGLTLEALGRHRFPDRKVLLTRDDTPVFREGHIGQIYAERGFGKTWTMQTLALIAAVGGQALRFRAPQPCRVLSVDGEMASQEIGIASTSCVTGCTLPRQRCSPSSLLTGRSSFFHDSTPKQDRPPWNRSLRLLTSCSSTTDPASLIPRVRRTPVRGRAAQDWLLSLRRRGKAVMLAHHSNRMGGARGHSKAEDPMNLLIKLTRPDDYSQDQGARFNVTFDNGPWRLWGGRGPVHGAADQRRLASGTRPAGLHGRQAAHSICGLQITLRSGHAPPARRLEGHASRRPKGCGSGPIC